MDVSESPALSASLAALAQAARLRGQEPTLSLAQTEALARETGLPRRAVELAALEREILPERYRRNLGTLGWAGQARLLRATVAVVGAGGLGGWIIEGLARMGVGRLIVIDGDHFQENNLNRQLGCTEETLDQAKADALARRVAQINGAVEVRAHVAWLNEANAPVLLGEAELVVDALDNLPSRMALQNAAARLGIPMVHGAIGGYTGQVMTIFPGDAGLTALYGPGPWPEHGVEAVLGNPAATPMMIAAWEIQEAVKVLSGQGQPLRGRMLFMDAELGSFTEIHLGQAGEG